MEPSESSLDPLPKLTVEIIGMLKGLHLKVTGD